MQSAAVSPGLGLTRRERRELRNRGFTDTEIAALDVLEEINQMLRESAERSAAKEAQLRRSGC
jgi:hypothetical protein